MQVERDRGITVKAQVSQSARFPSAHLHSCGLFLEDLCRLVPVPCRLVHDLLQPLPRFTVCDDVLSRPGDWPAVHYQPDRYAWACGLFVRGTKAMLPGLEKIGLCRNYRRPCHSQSLRFHRLVVLWPRVRVRCCWSIRHKVSEVTGLGGSGASLHGSASPIDVAETSGSHFRHSAIFIKGTSSSERIYLFRFAPRL